MCVCHLHGAPGLPQPTVSRHLAYLRKHGLVAGRNEGLWVHYRLATPTTDQQRALLGCLAVGLVGSEVFRRDRGRLGRVTTCCDP